MQVLPDRAGSRAVLLGIGAYTKLGARPKARDGAVELRRILTHPIHGCLPAEHCKLVGETAMHEEVGETLFEAASQATDLLLIYFTGHGLRSWQGDLYLALANTPRDLDPAFGGLPFNAIRFACMKTRAKAKIVILDCCFSGRALGDDLADEESIIREQVEIEGTAVLPSALSQDVAIILPGEKYPAYTKRLIDLLRDGLSGGPELLDIATLHNHIRAQLVSIGLRRPKSGIDTSFTELGLARNVKHAAVAAPGNAATASEYIRRLEDLMQRLGHSYQSIEAYAYAHGDYLPETTYRTVIVEAAERKELPPRTFVSAFIRACFCRNYDLPWTFDNDKLPASEPCRCEQPQIQTWLILYDHIASQTIDQDAGHPAENQTNGGRATFRQRWSQWRERQLRRGGSSLILDPNIFRVWKPANLIPSMAYLFSVTGGGSQELALAVMPGIAKRDLRHAASLLAGQYWLFDGRIAKFLQKLAEKEPEITTQLLQAIAETYPVKAIRLAELAEIPLPTTSDEDHEAEG